jgi:hypothetical protein
MFAMDIEEQLAAEIIDAMTPYSLVAWVALFG